MNHIDLFSGIGGFALAASWRWGNEYNNVAHSDIEEYACKVYHKHFPTSKCLGDITKIDWKEYENKIDLITGGFPCQPHSTAGKRLASKDERDLWGECKRAISEIRPKYALFENVSALLTSERGGFFNRVLSDLAEVGYNAEWHNISACSVGAPHMRNRVWVIAYTNKGRCYGNETILSRIITKEFRVPSDTYVGNMDCKWLINNGCVREHRKDDGLSEALDRLAALGNAIVPQVAYEIMKHINI